MNDLEPFYEVLALIILLSFFTLYALMNYYAGGFQ